MMFFPPRWKVCLFPNEGTYHGIHCCILFFMSHIPSHHFLSGIFQCSNSWGHHEEEYTGDIMKMFEWVLLSAVTEKGESAAIDGGSIGHMRNNTLGIHNGIIWNEWGSWKKTHHFNRDIILQRRSPKHTSYHFYTPICGDGTRTTFLNTLVLVYVQYMFRAWFILFMGYHYTTSDFPSLGTHMMTTIQWGEFFKHRIIKMALSKQMRGLTPYFTK